MDSLTEKSRKFGYREYGQLYMNFPASKFQRTNYVGTK